MRPIVSWLREAGKALPSVLLRLRQHIAEERAAIDSGDAATRVFLLADFAWPIAWATGC